MIQCGIGIAWSVYFYGIYIENIKNAVGASCGFLLLLLYNGKKGKLPKKFFYFFYPIHLLVLGICAVLMLLVHQSVAEAYFLMSCGYKKKLDFYFPANYNYNSLANQRKEAKGYVYSGRERNYEVPMGK